MGGSRSLDESIKVGPWGGDGGTDWSFKAEGGITEIVILHGSGGIYSISFKSYNGIGSGKVDFSTKFGGNGSGQTDKINLVWPGEFLTSISGTHDCCLPFGPLVIKSLRFCTNRTKYGPFGSESGTSFSFPMEDGIICGFHGRAGVFIDAIGVYVKPLVTSQVYQMKQEIANQKMISSSSLNIIVNHDFSEGLNSWHPNCSKCKGHVVSTKSSYPEGLSASSGGNYAVVTSRTVWYQGLEQDITRFVIPGCTYTVSACVGVWGPLHGFVDVMATLKLKFPHSADRFLNVGKASVSKENWEMLEGTFSLSSLPDQVLFYIEGPPPALDLLVKSVVITCSCPSKHEKGPVKEQMWQETCIRTRTSKEGPHQSRMEAERHMQKNYFSLRSALSQASPQQCYHSLQNPPISKPNLSRKHQQQIQQHHNLQTQCKISRRYAAALLSLLTLSHPAPATAFSFGISGPKDWLKEQRKKTSKFILAPIDASREILRSAYLLLMNRDSDYTSKELEEVQNLLRSAARDCVPQERNSFVAFQANTGVEVCTFKLIVKNASSLLDDKDPVKLEAEGMLNDLIRSFTSLNGLANETDIQLASNRQKVADALMDTISSLNTFEQGIKECLEI